MYPIATMCRLLAVSPSGYYAWRDRAPSARAKADDILTQRIAAIHTHSKGTYGVPRVHAELHDQGVKVGRKRVARLMGAAGLAGVSRRKGTRTTQRERAARRAPDRVERNFSAEAPNRLWVADATYVPTWAGFVFLAVVVDVFSRRVVGWSMANHLRTELMLGALNMALWQRQPEGVVHHSDQGSQYTSLAFGKRCREMGVELSMGSVGDCYDNALCESFFATLECELIDRRTFRTQAEARHAIFEYIEAWYNPRRRHSALGYLSPVDYECQAASLSACATESMPAKSNRMGELSPPQTGFGGVPQVRVDARSSLLSDSRRSISSPGPRNNPTARDSCYRRLVPLLPFGEEEETKNPKAKP